MDGAFILQAIFFLGFYPALCLWQWYDKKRRREQYQRKIDEAAIKGDKEAAARYIEALVKLK